MKNDGFIKAVREFPEHLTKDRLDALIDIQSKAYKFILADKEQGYCLLVNSHNSFFVLFKDDYNSKTVYIMRHLSEDSKKLIRRVVYATNCKSIKRAKKNASRIRKEMKKVYNLCFSKVVNKNEFLDAVDIFYYAIKDTFIISRRRLSVEAYNAIPDNLTEVCVSNNMTYLIKDAFVLNQATGKYHFSDTLSNPAIHLTNSDLRNINRTIAQYIFDVIH